MKENEMGDWDLLSRIILGYLAGVGVIAHVVFIVVAFSRRMK